MAGGTAVYVVAVHRALRQRSRLVYIPGLLAIFRIDIRMETENIAAMITNAPIAHTYFWLFR
jgi:hypothetical protein